MAEPTETCAQVGTGAAEGEGGATVGIGGEMGREEETGVTAEEEEAGAEIEEHTDQGVEREDTRDMRTGTGEEVVKVSSGHRCHLSPAGQINHGGPLTRQEQYSGPTQL